MNVNDWFVENEDDLALIEMEIREWELNQELMRQYRNEQQRVLIERRQQIVGRINEDRAKKGLEKLT